MITPRIQARFDELVPVLNNLKEFFSSQKSKTLYSEALPLLKIMNPKTENFSLRDMRICTIIHFLGKIDYVFLGEIEDEILFVDLQNFPLKINIDLQTLKGTYSIDTAAKARGFEGLSAYMENHPEEANEILDKISNGEIIKKVFV